MIKLIEDSKNYYITVDGKVLNSKNKEMKSDVSSRYKRVQIYFEDGTTRKELVHRLVAKAFIPNPENKPFVNHIDGNKHNNTVENLEWVTPKENGQHASKSGLLESYSGENHYCSEYTTEQVERICQMLSEGYRNKDISEIVQVPVGLVSSVRTKASWKHVSDKYPNIKKKRHKRASIETVDWICSKLEQGMTIQQIVDESNSEVVNFHLVYDIKVRKTYKYVSNKYKF